jgi:ABC-type glycerol-3-phosphate transport system substrate-binding protein
MVKTLLVIVLIGVIGMIGSFNALAGGQQEPAAKEGAKEFEGIEIDAALQSLPSTTFLTEKLPEFEARTGMKVRLHFLPEIELWDRIVMDVSTGVGTFEVIGMDPMFIPEFVEAGWIWPIDEYVNKDAAYDVNDVMPKYLGINKYKDKLYGLPVYGETTIIWYRKDLFDQAGVRPPDTLEEFWNAAKKFHNPPGVYGVAMRGMRGSSMNMFIYTTFMKAFGAEFFDSSWNPAFNNEAGVKAAEYYRDILTKYGPPGVATFTWDDTAIAYANSQVAMIIDSIDFLDRVVDPEKSKVIGKVGCAQVPQGPGGRHPAIFTLGLALSKPANKTNKQKEASATFMKWATSIEIEQGKAFEAHIPTPTRRVIFEDPRFVAKYGEKAYPGWLSSYMADLEIADPDFRPRLVEWREFGDRLGVAIEEIIAGIKPAKQALDDAAVDIRDIFKASGRLK